MPITIMITISVTVKISPPRALLPDVRATRPSPSRRRHDVGILKQGIIGGILQDVIEGVLRVVRQTRTAGSGGTTRGSSSCYSGRSGSNSGSHASGLGQAPSCAPSSNLSSRSRLLAASLAAAAGTAALERLTSVNTNDASTLEERSGGRRRDKGH